MTNSDKGGEVGMKFIVDEIPKSKSKCPFSEWKPYPPIVEEAGHYICKINHNDCNLCETECQLLKEQMPVKPYQDYNGHDIWRCGKCGATICNIYHTEADEDSKNYAKFCIHCGSPIEWEST